jgi:RNA polymerase sigma-70 factor (ECF subfamily)
MGSSSSQLEAPVHDAGLVQAFLAGDTGAFGALVARHQETVYRLVRRYAKSPEDARDLTQRAFLQAFEASRRALPRLLQSTQGVPFRAWVLRIAINLGKNHVRDAARWPRAQVEVLDSQRSNASAADAQLERAQLEALTRRAVLALPKRQREVFTLRTDAALPFAEVASTLGISEGNAKAHFHHALNRLREEVAKLMSGGRDDDM